MEIIKKTLVVLILCSFIVGTVPISVLAQQNNPDKKNFKIKGPNLPEGVEYASGEFIVQFKPGVSNEKIASINSNHGTSVIYTSPNSGFKKLRIPNGKSVHGMVEKYKNSPYVVYAEPDYIAYASMLPNDPYYQPYQWNFDNNEYGGINMEEAWEISSDAGAGVIVAVLDTGVAYEDYVEDGIEYALAPDLAGTTFELGRDFVNNDMHANDDAGHGTHVTGTIAQTTNNGKGVAGIAYNAHIMPVKVLDSSGSGYYSWIAEGIRYATDNGAKVISMSLGGPRPSITLKNALSYAYENGVTIVCSSGNDGSDTKISYPAAYDAYCIAVGATRYDEEVAYYSNGGSSLDLTAPGGDVYVDQNDDTYGDGILQQTHDGTDYTNFEYYFYQGTSMAAPHVSAVAALVISAGIATTPDEVREVLQSTAEDKGSAGWDQQYGYGIVDAYAALNYASAPNEPPIAEAGGPYSGDEGVAISFDGSESFDLDGDIVSYQWDFGDGTEFASGITTTHTYTNSGTYTVTLTVINNDGATGTDTATVTVNKATPLPTMYISSISMELQITGINTNAIATVTVSGANDPIEGAEVSGYWSYGSTYEDDDGITDASGTVILISDKVKRASGTFTFTVTNVICDGLTWDGTNSIGNIEV